MSSSSKNIVIIGASAGANVARDLIKSLPNDSNIVLIDPLPVAFHKVSSLRSSVLPGHETKSTHSLENFFGKDSRHKVINAKAVGIQQGIVTLDKEVSGFGNSVDFKYLIVATGSTYSFPASPKGETEEEIIENFKKVQDEVKQAQNILIVGGGPVGVEFAGEVKEVYPNKKITLLSSSNHLINSEFTSLSNKLISQLKSKGVSIQLSSRIDISNLTSGLISTPQDFTLENGEIIQNVDFILLATGSKPNVSLIKDSDSDSILVKDGIENCKS